MIIVTQCDALSPSRKFSSFAGGGIAGANYLKVKNGVTHWETIIPAKSQIHAVSNFLLLSS